VVRAVQEQVIPYENNLFRTRERLEPALAAVNGVWADLPGGSYRAREAAAMTAHARWMFTAALARTETRGMHKRADFPNQDPRQAYRLITGGLDELWTVPEPDFLRGRTAVSA
jgi:succinate dehydrogenase/fumarate reductase flavoprotein subunit